MFSLTNLIRPNTKIKVIDIGASLTEDPLYLPLVKSGVASLLAFEPDQAECSKLSEKFGDDCIFLDSFVADGKERTFYETNWFATGSLFKPNPEVLDQYCNLNEHTILVEEHQVKTVTLDSLSEAKGADYIKIDVQGAELDVFNNGADCLSSVCVIDTEVWFVEGYQNQPLFSDIDKLLRELGYRFAKFIGGGTRNLRPLSSGENGSGCSLVWADVLYYRDVRSFKKITSDQLIKMAIIMHDLYKQYDVAALALSHLDVRHGTQYAKKYVEMLAREQ